MRFPGVALLAALLFLAACQTASDSVPPEVRFIHPQAGDSIVPGVYVMKAIATDDVAMRWVSFWAFDEMLGIVRTSHADTYSLGIDCRTDTLPFYRLAAIAEDKAGNEARDTLTVFVRR